MFRLVTRRCVETALLVLLISLICFGLMHAVPGGPTAMLSQNPTVRPADLERIHANFGLDKPVVVQYVFWLERVLLHGDFGYSYATGEPVLRMIWQRLPATLELMGVSFLLAVTLAFLVGAVSAVRRNTVPDAAFTVTSLVLISLPLFWLGLLFMMLFSVKWGLLPSAGRFTLGEPFSLGDHVAHLVMPAGVLTMVLAAGWSRYVRESLVDTLSTTYVRVARAKGLPARAVVLRHALRGAAPPVITVIALNLPLLFTGSIIIETIFSWPGMGRLFYEGLLRQDYPRLMGIVFFTSILIVLFNLLADVLHEVLDPRTRYAG